MSLQLAAQHLSAHGRGPDTTLVHMAPKEVAGLQALAMRHGGSLTINPQTGLPEAGFLASILPMLGGMALAATGIGAPAAALLMGGGTAIATGDLKKGLMAGLGAYGGAGLGESLINSGAAGLLPQAAAGAEGVASAVPQAAEIAATNQAGLTIPSTVEPSISASLPSANAADPFRLGSTASQETLKASTLGGTSAPVGGITAQSPNYTSPVTTTPSPLSNVNNITSGGPMSGPSISNSTYPVQPPSPENMTMGQRFDALKSGATGQNLLNYAKANPFQTAGMVAGPLMSLSENNNPTTPTGDSDRGAMANAGYQYDPGWANPMPTPDPYGREQIYNRPRYYIPKAANGGEVTKMAGGGISGSGSLHVDVPISVGGSGGGAGGNYQEGRYPFGSGADSGGMGGLDPNAIAADPQGFQRWNQQRQAQQGSGGMGAGLGFLENIFRPLAQQMQSQQQTNQANNQFSNGLSNSGGMGGTGELGKMMGDNGSASNNQYAAFAAGGEVLGQYNLGSYSDGGRLLRGPGDGVSDSIPAVIGRKQPARLADGEFVVPARIVSEIGNGSTEAGARKLYAMMDKVQKARRATVGKGKVAKNTRADRYLPA